MYRKLLINLIESKNQLNKTKVTKMSVHVKIVKQLYDHVIADVINNISEYFIEDGIEDDVLAGLKEMWLRKLNTNTKTNFTEVINSSDSSGSSAEAQVSVPIAFTMAGSEPKVFDLKVPASALKESNYSAKLVHALGNEDVNKILHMTISDEVKKAMLQSIIDKCWSSDNVIQLDGPYSDDSDTEDEDECDEDEENEEDEDEDELNDEATGDEYVLTDDDDIIDDEFTETDNVVACQYESIKREKNQWKLHLRKGVMNINGRDFVFDQLIGDATW